MTFMKHAINKLNAYYWPTFATSVIVDIIYFSFIGPDHEPFIIALVSNILILNTVYLISKLFFKLCNYLGIIKIDQNNRIEWLSLSLATLALVIDYQKSPLLEVVCLILIFIGFYFYLNRTNYQKNNKL